MTADPRKRCYSPLSPTIPVKTQVGIHYNLISIFTIKYYLNSFILLCTFILFLKREREREREREDPPASVF
jgi:hypothetical protein